jgi:hypothetical protein
MLAALTFLIGIAYLPGTESATTAGRWAAMGLIAIPLWRKRVPCATPAHWMLAALLLCMAVGIPWALSPYDAVGELRQWIMLAAVFCVAAEEHDLGPCWKALSLAITVSLPFSVAQWLGYDPVESLSLHGSGLFLDKNTMTEVAVIAVVANVLRGEWSFAVAPAIAMALTDDSREGILALIAAAGTALWMIGGRRSRAALVAGALVAIAATWELGGFRGAGVAHITDRLEIWHAALANATWMGHGLGAFGALFDGWTALGGQALPGYEFAHNELFQYVFDLGAGAVFMAGVAVYAMGTPGIAERAAFAAFLACAAVWFPLHEPMAAFLAAVLAGGLCGARGRVSAARHLGRNRRSTRTHRSWGLGAAALR